MLDRRYSLNLHNNCPSIESSQLQTELKEVYQRSVADLTWEIAVLEEEVVRKELHLLSLYRIAFDQYLDVSPRASAQVEQESRRQHSSRTTDEGALRLRNIKESAPTTSQHFQILNVAIIARSNHQPQRY